MPIRVVMEQLDAEAEARKAEESREVLGAGFRSRESSASGHRSGSGFGSGEALDVLEPCPSLAAMADGVTRDGRMAELDDDELVGVLRAWRRLESWSAAGTFAAVAELARRRPADGAAPASPGGFPELMSEFVSDEVAAALVLTGQAASTCLDLALDLATRLPGTARALRAGIIDYLKARIIAEATRVLSDADARAVEEMVLPGAGGQTSGRLRAALAKAVLAVDPEAAARRRELAEKDPRVRRWREDAGTAALAGYSLPAAEVLEADQAITSRALDLRAAGVPGTLEELRARAYLDALLGRDSAVLGEPAPGPECEPGSGCEPGSAGRSPAGGPSGPAGGDAAGAGPGSREPGRSLPGRLIGRPGTLIPMTARGRMLTVRPLSSTATARFGRTLTVRLPGRTATARPGRTLAAWQINDRQNPIVAAVDGRTLGVPVISRLPRQRTATGAGLPGRGRVRAGGWRRGSI